MLGFDWAPTSDGSDDSPLSFPEATSGERRFSTLLMGPDSQNMKGLLLTCVCAEAEDIPFLHQLPKHDPGTSLTTTETKYDLISNRASCYLAEGMLLECIAKVSQNETEDRGH